MNAPVAKQIHQEWKRVTGDVDDPFAWLLDRDDPDTVSYLEAENVYANSWFATHTALLDDVFAEIKSRVQETDSAAPVPKDGWFYVSSTVEGKNYPIHQRGRSATAATAQLVLDQNVEAEDHEFFDLGAFEVSPDQRFAAWSADTRGDEHYLLRIRDIETAVDLDDELHDTTWAGVAWSADCTHLFYVVADDQERPYLVMRHEVGTSQAADVEVFVDHDERFYVGVGATRNGQAIIIQSGSKLSSECWVIDATNATEPPVCVRPRADDLEYHIDHWGDRWIVVTNLDAPDFRVMTAPLVAPSEWAELVAHEPGRRISGAEPFADHLALQEWFEAQPQIRIVARDGSTRPLVIDAEPHDVGVGANEEWHTERLRLTHQSLTVPARVIDVDVTTGEITVVKETPTPNVDLQNYVSTRVWATAPDGTALPIDVVHHVDTALDGTAPACVYGYGSYEISIPPWFSVARLSWLDRGGVWALVHPRGGGELGRNWYLDGKLLNKRNTFTDTLACCEHLAATNVAARNRIAIRGGSAGGLLVGACVTMEPERFASAVAEVPFVDVVTTMSDPSLPLTVTEWDEWGDPRAEPFASYMLSYSPYDHTAVADYPAIFITAGLNDPRVSYHEPAKWTAKLRTVNTGTSPILLRTEMGAGHGGASGRYDAWRDEARVLVFLLTTT
ncbi:MAG TPA: S9 family peptidase [Ilumatobacter sp.]|nr:S9 family peptidase [Ilumatobacter sp.]